MRQEEERLTSEEAPKGGVEETKIEPELDQDCKKKKKQGHLASVQDFQSCLVQGVLPGSYIENTHILQAGRSMGT